MERAHEHFMENIRQMNTAVFNKGRNYVLGLCWRAAAAFLFNP